MAANPFRALHPECFAEIGACQRIPSGPAASIRRIQRPDTRPQVRSSHHTTNLLPSRGRPHKTRRRGVMDPGRALDDVTGEIVDAAFKLHTSLGPGLLESVYEMILYRDLQKRGLHVERQKRVSFEYDGLLFDDGLRVDLLVDARVIVEIKSVEKAAAVHRKQDLTYLCLLK